MAKSSKKSATAPSKKSTPAKRPAFTKAKPKKLLRKVPAPASAGPTPAAAAKTAAGPQPMSIVAHVYRIAWTPGPCTDWAVGDYVEIYVPEPPPASVTFDYGDDCDGTRAVFIS